jgi:hypothetical protein
MSFARPVLGGLSSSILPDIVFSRHKGQGGDIGKHLKLRFEE